MFGLPFDTSLILIIMVGITVVNLISMGMQIKAESRKGEDGPS